MRVTTAAMPPPTTPVHVNDIAGVSTTLAAAARERGEEWQVWHVPAGRGRSPLLALSRRGVDWARWLAVRRRYGPWHIHYGVTGYYGWGQWSRRRSPVLLHLHGTDVRQDLRSRWLGPVVRRSMSVADVVLYSTPDLAEPLSAAGVEAEWFPAPVPLAALDQPSVPLPPGPPTVCFISRWDDSKGGPRLVELARGLRRARPDVDLVGIDWGTYRHDAAAAGVRLRPLLPPDEFRRLLASSHVLVGQLAYGLLGVADLEAMLVGRTLLAHFGDEWIGPGAYGERPPIVDVGGESDLVGSVVDALGRLDEQPGAAQAARAWVERYHDPRRLSARAAEMYRDLTS